MFSNVEIPASSRDAESYTLVMDFLPCHPMSCGCSCRLQRYGVLWRDGIDSVEYGQQFTASRGAPQLILDNSRMGMESPETAAKADGSYHALIKA